MTELEMLMRILSDAIAHAFVSGTEPIKAAEQAALAFNAGLEVYRGKVVRVSGRKLNVEPIIEYAAREFPKDGAPAPEIPC